MTLTISKELIQHNVSYSFGVVLDPESMSRRAPPAPPYCCSEVMVGCAIRPGEFSNSVRSRHSFERMAPVHAGSAPANLLKSWRLVMGSGRHFGSGTVSSRTLLSISLMIFRYV